MKIFELLNSLTPDEKKLLKKNFFTSNKQLAALWTEVHSCSETEFQVKKSQLFRKIYGKPLNDKSEKIFKNHLTELFRAIRAQIGHIWMEETEIVELNKYINYINTLGLRQANDLFEKEWNYFLNQFETSLFHFRFYIKV